MLKLEKLHPQYLTSAKGKKVAVLLPIEEYNELLEDLEDLAVIAARKEEPLISHNEVLKKLKKDELL